MPCRRYRKHLSDSPSSRSFVVWASRWSRRPEPDPVAPRSAIAIRTCRPGYRKTWVSEYRSRRIRKDFRDKSDCRAYNRERQWRCHEHGECRLWANDAGSWTPPISRSLVLPPWSYVLVGRCCQWRSLWKFDVESVEMNIFHVDISHTIYFDDNSKRNGWDWLLRCDIELRGVKNPAQRILCFVPLCSLSCFRALFIFAFSSRFTIQVSSIQYQLFATLFANAWFIIRR